MATASDGRSQPASINWVKTGVLALVLAVIAFLLSPNAPFGGFWAPAATMPKPTAGQLPFFILLNIAEVVTFGLGVAFLVFGYPMVRAIAPASLGLTRAVHLSIAWLLLSWWSHDSLHIYNGLHLGGLLVIEYLFHVTLMIAGVILAYFFLTLHRRTGAETR
jgi:hypothetical protein